VVDDEGVDLKAIDDVCVYESIRAALLTEEFIRLLSQSSEVFGAERVIHFPIRDNWIPTSMFRLVKLVSRICDQLKVTCLTYFTGER